MSKTEKKLLNIDHRPKKNEGASSPHTRHKVLTFKFDLGQLEQVRGRTNTDERRRSRTDHQRRTRTQSTSGLDSPKAQLAEPEATSMWNELSSRNSPAHFPRGFTSRQVDADDGGE